MAVADVGLVACAVVAVVAAASARTIAASLVAAAMAGVVTGLVVELVVLDAPYAAAGTAVLGAGGVLLVAGAASCLGARAPARPAPAVLRLLVVAGLALTLSGSLLGGFNRLDGEGRSLWTLASGQDVALAVAAVFGALAAAAGAARAAAIPAAFAAGLALGVLAEQLAGPYDAPGPGPWLMGAGALVVLTAVVLTLRAERGRGERHDADRVRIVAPMSRGTGRGLGE